MEKASQDQARHYNLRRRQWTPAVSGLSVGHLPESSAITPGGKDTYEDGTGTNGDPDRFSVCHLPESSGKLGMKEK